MQAQLFDIRAFVEQFVQRDTIMFDEVRKREGFNRGLIEGINAQL